MEQWGRSESGLRATGSTELPRQWILLQLLNFVLQRVVQRLQRSAELQGVAVCLDDTGNFAWKSRNNHMNHRLRGCLYD